MKEPRWPSALAVLAAVGLYATLPNILVPGPSWVRFVVPVLFLAVLVPLAVTAPHRHVEESGARRRAAMTLTALITFANAVALAFLVHQLVYVSGVAGRTLLYGAFDIWVTNVIAFALWYWELDGGGPPKRLADPKAPRDFAFIQMTDPEVAAPGWHPRFVDYLYVSFTNASAFSPTDTMPLSPPAKLLMLVQSTASLVTIGMVFARAINVLTGG